MAMGLETEPYKNDDYLEISRLYFREVGQFNLISHQEVVMLALEAAKGSIEARNALVEANLRLVVTLAKRKLGKGIGLDDLIQEGNIALIRAAEGFDCEKGYRFSTYAIKWINSVINQITSEQRGNFRIPSGMMRKFEAQEDCLTQLLGRMPKIDELANFTGLNARQIERYRFIHNQLVSIDAPKEDEDPNTNVAEEVIGNSYKQDLSSVIAAILDNPQNTILDEREKTILVARYFPPQKTLRQIAAENGCSHTRVGQIEKEALSKLSKVAELKRLFAELTERDEL